jgi:ubiquinone/menaquinone biosynthesis C-methylase UbiE
MHEKRFSGDIDRLRNPERIARLDLEWVITLCLEGSGIKRVLDIGTGTGLFAEEFAKRGLSVTGADVNPEMLPAAHSFVAGGDFCQAGAEDLPFEKTSFDLVFMGLLLHESDEQVQVLRESRRVARGRVGILEWAFREEEFGPPLAHRLSPEILAKMVNIAGYSNYEVIPLTKLVFYRLTV